ncbi:MAG: PKD domain-containing protein [Syntrophobacteria bacterium]
MQAKTSFFIALFLILFLQTAIASRVLADADAGPDQTVNEGDTVYLDGSGSTPEDDDDDDDDKIQSYLWEQVKGKPKVILTGADQAIASFIAPQVSRDRRLTFKLTVRFASGSKDTDETKVKVLDDNNDPPTADAGPDQNVDEETTVTLDGSNSSDPDDGIESYLWKQTAGPSVSLSNPQAVKPTFLAPDVGTDGVSFTFELTVTDYSSLQSTDTAIINVIWLNDPPTANAGTDQTVLEKSTVTLDGSNSSDPDDGVASYQWKQVAGQSVTFSDPTDDQPTFEAPSFDDSGDKPLVFDLIVTDEGGLQSSDSTTVSVSNFEKDNPGASGGGCFIETAAYGFSMAQ